MLLITNNKKLEKQPMLFIITPKKILTTVTLQQFQTIWNTFFTKDIQKLEARMKHLQSKLTNHQLKKMNQTNSLTA